MKHKHILRRGLGILLSLMMCLSLMLTNVLAEGTDPECEHQVPAAEEGQDDAVRFRFVTTSTQSCGL